MATLSPFRLLPVTRRRLMATLLAGLAIGPGRARPAGASAMHPARLDARSRLAEVRAWGCQYQNINPRALAASPLDLVAIDISIDDYSRRFVTPAELAMLRRKPDGGRRLVLAYLCIGETDVKRWYWPARWQRRPPDWVGAPNPHWPGSHHVRFWNREWQELVFRGDDSLLGIIQKIGFDGALLDRTDAYLDWRDERDSVEDDMVDMVVDLAHLARTRDPGFLLLPQNGERLLTRQHFLDAIDAHNKESLLTGLAGEGAANAQADIEWSLGYLHLARDAGVRMLATEYLADPAAIAMVGERLNALGFLPFFADRQLDRLPQAPPAGAGQ